MSVISRIRKQKFVYWGSPVRDADDGYKSFAKPVELDGRWEKGVIRVEDENGAEIAYDGLVYSENQLDAEGFIFMGEESLLPRVHDDPQITDGIFQIDSVGALPNIRATEFLYTAMLKARS